FSLTLPPRLKPTLFPYTTLFRSRCNPRYGSFMETLNLRPFNRRHEDPAIQIAPAHDCDGSLCHQPIFREDGTLNYVAPHCHLVEDRKSTRLNSSHVSISYAVFCL